MLIFGEGGRPENAEKNPRSKDENQQQTQPTYDAGSENRTRDTLVGGERSHHCAIPAPGWNQINVDYVFTKGEVMRFQWRSKKLLVSKIWGKSVEIGLKSAKGRCYGGHKDGYRLRIYWKVSLLNNKGPNFSLENYHRGPENVDCFSIKKWGEHLNPNCLKVCLRHT